MLFFHTAGVMCWILGQDCASVRTHATGADPERSNRDPKALRSGFGLSFLLRSGTGVRVKGVAGSDAIVAQ